jgi:hypothetical protein
LSADGEKPARRRLGIPTGEGIVLSALRLTCGPWGSCQADRRGDMGEVLGAL